MSEESLIQVGPTAVSLLALLLSLFNLYLQRRDRRPRLEIRARYEYRTGDLDVTSGGEASPPLIHDESQEGLYLLLGDFLKEYGLEYPPGCAGGAVRPFQQGRQDRLLRQHSVGLLNR